MYHLTHPPPPHSLTHLLTPHLSVLIPPKHAHSYRHKHSLPHTCYRHSCPLQGQTLIHLYLLTCIHTLSHTHTALLPPHTDTLLHIHLPRTDTLTQHTVSDSRVHPHICLHTCIHTTLLQHTHTYTRQHAYPLTHTHTRTCTLSLSLTHTQTHLHPYPHRHVSLHTHMLTHFSPEFLKMHVLWQQ